MAAQNLPIPSKKYAINPMDPITAKTMMIFFDKKPPLPLKRVRIQEAPVITLERLIQTAKNIITKT